MRHQESAGANPDRPRPRTCPRESARHTFHARPIGSGPQDTHLADRVVLWSWFLRCIHPVIPTEANPIPRHTGESRTAPVIPAKAGIQQRNRTRGQVLPFAKGSKAPRPLIRSRQKARPRLSYLTGLFNMLEGKMDKYPARHQDYTWRLHNLLAIGYLSANTPGHRSNMNVA